MWGRAKHHLLRTLAYVRQGFRLCDAFRRPRRSANDNTGPDKPKTRARRRTHTYADLIGNTPDSRTSRSGRRRHGRPR